MKNYFEGWYFKQSSENFGIAFIPGIAIQNGNKRAFIQVITTSTSYCIFYDSGDFSSSASPFWVRIGNNFFSKERITIDIEDEKQNLKIYGSLHYGTIQEISKSLFSPSIMGPFAYVPFMECNHGILSMKHSVNGVLSFNNAVYEFNNGIGYIEKDSRHFIS